MLCAFMACTSINLLYVTNFRSGILMEEAINVEMVTNCQSFTKLENLCHAQRTCILPLILTHITPNPDPYYPNPDPYNPQS